MMCQWNFAEFLRSRYDRLSRVADLPIGSSHKFEVRPSSIGTLDRFVSRTESPSSKRKLSEESLSPASVQNLKSTRTDGADEVS